MWDDGYMWVDTGIQSKKIIRQQLKENIEEEVSIYTGIP